MRLLDGIPCELALMSLHLRQLLTMRPRPEIRFTVKGAPDGATFSFGGETFAIDSVCERLGVPDPVAFCDVFVATTLREVAPWLCEYFAGIEYE